MQARQRQVILTMRQIKGGAPKVEPCRYRSIISHTQTAEVSLADRSVPFTRCVVVDQVWRNCECGGENFDCIVRELRERREAGLGKHGRDALMHA